MGNSGSTNKIVITAASVAAIVASGLYSLCSSSSSALNSQDQDQSSELDSEKSNSTPVTNSHNSAELDIVQSNSWSVSNSQDSGCTDNVRSSSGLFAVSHESVLIDLLSGSATIGWQFPPTGWVKCNVDGSSRKFQRSAGCGGVYRDGQGKWVNGFARKLDYCSSMKAEILAIYTGLAEAWRLGFRNLTIESDSKSAVDVVNRGRSASRKLANPIRKAKKYLRMEWQVNIVYIPRKYNRVADWLSKFSHELQVGVHELEKPPKGCSKFLLKDKSCATCLPKSTVSYSSYQSRGM